ncbi:MAG TPA: chromosomal replication initiator protein DnaA [Candidatus Babeliales bacterium]|nr:chromosomal replication initiator protein DnaA [Candidatus Babeliales bacterium]
MVSGIWEQFLTIVKEEHGSRVVETWFKAVSLAKWDSLQKIVYLKVPNVFVKEWLARNYSVMIQVHLGRLLNVDGPTITFVDSDIVPAQEQSIQAQNSDNTLIPAVTTPISKELVEHSVFDRSRGHFNRTYSFDTFVVGSHNSLAYAAAHAVTEQPGQLYNPLFIYGGSGLGKTHLLHSIGNGIKVKNKSAVVLYQTTDRFVNEFINAIRFNKVHIFQAKYKHVDVLLIDDVQFISNKEQTQEAFFHIFNVLYESHKQIVLSSDTVPGQIQGLAERLRSRLAWGLVADIQQPSLETKIAIVKKKAELSNELIGDDVAHFVASRTVANIRELEGALIRVIAFASLTKQMVTLDLAKKVLARLTPAEPTQPSYCDDFASVIRCVNRYYSYDLEQLRSKSRNKDIAFARQVTMFLMKKVTNKSLRDIGEFLGGRDHSTVMHAIAKVEQHAEVQPEFFELLKRMEQESLH